MKQFLTKTIIGALAIGSIILIQACEKNLSPTDPNALGALQNSVSTKSQSADNRRMIVSDCNPMSWFIKKQKGALGSVSFVTGPDKPPWGDGSLEFNVPDTKRLRFVDNQFLNLHLSDISEMTLATYVGKRSVYKNNVDVVMQIDVNGDGIDDLHLVFDPYYQTTPWAATGNLDQGRSVVGKWKHWDLYNGLWFHGPTLDTDPADPEEGAQIMTLKEWSNLYKGATIASSADSPFSLRLTAGGADAFFGPDFIGYADKFIIDIAGKAYKFDFEKCQP